MNWYLEPGSVLVGVDGSAGSDLALSWAATYAQHRGRPLVVLHVAGTLVHPDAAGRVVANRALEDVRAHHPDVPVTAHAVLGDPRAVLAQLAADASALVVGSRGRGPLASLLLGSVSVALAAQAPCPVVVVRPPPAALAASDQSVVVGVDGNPDSAYALTLAFEQASSQYRPLEVVHAVGSLILFPYPDLVGSGLVEQSQRAAERLLDESLAGYAEKFPDVVVHRRLVGESPTQALVAASRTASTVVVGCRGRGAVSGHLLGSVSRSVVERALSTVVVVRGSGT
jgi:nucleotide-binding universal stress UspA family protein